MATDIHGKDFDDGTIVKLDILRQYLRKWLPTFIENPNPWYKDIIISDLFAGEGTDSSGNLGSPLIILDEISTYCSSLKSKNLSLTALFNEGLKKKVDILEEKCGEFLNSCYEENSKEDKCPNSDGSKCIPRVAYGNDKFEDGFGTLYNDLTRIQKIPHFMFLDQYGIKQVTKDVFEKVSNLKTTDLLFFIASSFAQRFAELPEFKKYLELSRPHFDTEKSEHCHRVICDYYRSLIPEDVEFYIAPFSIKKGRNIYGLIFGSHHLVGLKKFLEVAWNIDPVTGEANYDIDDDSVRDGQLSLFEEENIIKKQDVFEKALVEFIIEPRTNKDIFGFALINGFLPKHAKAILKEMQSDDKVDVFQIGTTNKARRGSFYLTEKDEKVTIIGK